MVRRETLIHLGLGAASVVAATAGAFWLTRPAAPKPQTAQPYPIEKLEAAGAYEPVELAFDTSAPARPAVELAAVGNEQLPPWYEASEPVAQLQAFPPIEEETTPFTAPENDLQPLPEFSPPLQAEPPTETRISSVLIGEGDSEVEEELLLAAERVFGGSPTEPPAATGNEFVPQEEEIEFTGPLADPFAEIDAAHAEANQPEPLPPQPQESPQPEPVASQRPFNQPPPVASSVDMRQVNIQAKRLIDEGVQRYERHMLAAAKVKFVRSIRVVTQSLDAQRFSAQHSQALAQAIRAMEEAGDFASSGSSLEGNVNISLIVASHRTPVLKNYGDDLKQITPMVATQRYFQFAQQRLADACGNQPVASRALFAWGKVVMAEASKRGNDGPLTETQGMALYQAALMVDARNQRAANELGVALARYGKLADARDVLVHSVLTSPTQESWQNLAAVHQRLGEDELARRARYEGQLIAQRTPVAPAPDMSVRWVSPHEFTTGQPAPQLAQVAPAPQPEQRKAPWWAPWRR